MSARIVLSGGGTGGHAYPAISIAEALRAESPNCRLLYIGGKDSPEERLAANAGIEFVAISTRKLQKLLSLGTVLTMASLVKGAAQSARALHDFKADVVIGTGGYGAAGVVMAQVLRRGKTMILEPDAVAGRTNRWIGRFAQRICLGFEEAAKFFPEGRTVFTGSPVRSGLLNLPEQSDARKSLGLDPDLLTILVIGGSQGALSINRAIVAAAPELRKLPIQILHQVGTRNIEEAEAARKEAGWEHYHVRPYLDDMYSAYASADLIVNRCGMSTISEITVVGLPSILVPYPYSHADHQRFNAESIADRGAGVLILDSELNERLAPTIKSLISSPEELRKMAHASRLCGKPNAARDIAKMALEMAEENGRSK